MVIGTAGSPRHSLFKMAGGVRPALVLHFWVTLGEILNVIHRRADC